MALAATAETDEDMVLTVTLPDSWEDEDKTEVISPPLLTSLTELCKTVESGAYVIVEK